MYHPSSGEFFGNGIGGRVAQFFGIGDEAKFGIIIRVAQHKDHLGSHVPEPFYSLVDQLATNSLLLVFRYHCHGGKDMKQGLLIPIIDIYPGEQNVPDGPVVVEGQQGKHGFCCAVFQQGGC